MRKITEQALKAFVNGTNFKSGNTRIEAIGNEVFMYLHDNLIASRTNRKPIVRVCSAGWQTVTTKERLNAIIEHYLSPADKIYQKNFVWYWKGNITFPSNELVKL